jgi:hypothetical protein
MHLRPIIYVVAGGLLGLTGAQVWKAVHRPDAASAGSAALAMATNQAPPTDFVPAIDPAMLEPQSPAPETPLLPTAAPRKQVLTDIDNVQFTLRDFRTRLGGNPTGTNAEIMKTMMGDNIVQARFGPAEGQRLNDNGELTDRWGTPYFFHQLSKNEMEIRSAGPDHSMWTADDIVSK